jgi:hypothetical protein
VVRDGDTLKRIGKMAELFDDHSPLQLHSAGRWSGQSFTLVGRLQYQYPEGTWTEWFAMLADGTTATLSEDNGAYVFSTAQPQQRALPAAEFFRLGASTAINGKTFSVTSNQQVLLLSAQGELPRLPPLGQAFAMVELRSQSGDTAAGGEVLSIDYISTPPALSLGRAVQLDDLQLTGLNDESVKSGTGRQLACPNCGASLSIQLSGTQSLTCPSCKSIIDVSQGTGGELSHALQDEPVNPTIALGSTGELQGVSWQVVGYQHRMGADPTSPDEQFGWEEYLLYNARRGFTFLVDSTEGWSVVKPATGAPVVAANGQSASYLGTRYTFKEAYVAETNYVVGEFYWRVQRGQKTNNRDYASADSMLNMEQSAQELTWSVGGKIASEAVAKAFKLEDKAALLKRADVGPFVASGGPLHDLKFWVFVLIVLVILAMSTCSSNCDPNVENCSSSRTSGGSYGGFSTGGGHK